MLSLGIHIWCAVSVRARAQNRIKKLTWSDLGPGTLGLQASAWVEVQTDITRFGCLVQLAREVFSVFSTC